MVARDRRSNMQRLARAERIRVEMRPVVSMPFWNALWNWLLEDDVGGQVEHGQDREGPKHSDQPNHVDPA